MITKIYNTQNYSSFEIIYTSPKTQKFYKINKCILGFQPLSKKKVF